MEFYLSTDLARWWDGQEMGTKGSQSPPAWTHLKDDEWLVLQITPAPVYNAKTKSDAIKVTGVIKREFDNLTKEEIITHAKQVSQAKFEELKRWHDLDCFRRMPRSQSTNRVDGTRVLTWEKVRA